MFLDSLTERSNNKERLVGDLAYTIEDGREELLLLLLQIQIGSLTAEQITSPPLPTRK